MIAWRFDFLTMDYEMRPEHMRLAIILGLLALAGPFAVDMYLPALPELAADLNVSPGQTQATLAFYFLTFGLAQLIYGPWSDQVGRKLPLYFGMGLFLIATIGAAMAQTLEALVLWRGLQGAGGAVAMVVPRAVIRDTETGPAATKMMAMIMLVIAISPMVAPLTGALVSSFAGWRGIFLVMAAMAVMSLVLTGVALPETHKTENRTKFRMGSFFKGLGTLIRHPGFMCWTFIGAFGFSSFFVFIASAPFVYQTSYGLSDENKKA